MRRIGNALATEKHCVSIFVRLHQTFRNIGAVFYKLHRAGLLGDLSYFDGNRAICAGRTRVTLNL